MDEAHNLNTWEGYVDWRNRPAVKGRHGGIVAASFVLAVEVLENLAYLANASNLVLYLSKFMHFSPSNSANVVTNFMGLYLVDLGVGGIKGSLPPHGAEQFDETTKRGRKQRSAFFNYYVFCLSCGALLAVTFLVWVEDNKGWQWGFGISSTAILISIPTFLLGSPFYRTKIPSGSPITTMFKVLAAATCNKCGSGNSSNAITSMNICTSCIIESSGEDQEIICRISKDTNVLPISQTPTSSLKFLNRALQGNPSHPKLACTVKEVEEVKIVIKILPIFASTIILNCCLAQLSTFSVQQAASMNTKIGSLKVPPASLPVSPKIGSLTVSKKY